MPGLDPGIHHLQGIFLRWMAGSSPAMTSWMDGYDCACDNLPAAVFNGKKGGKNRGGRPTEEAAAGGKMGEIASTPGVVGPFAGLDIPWLLKMRAEVRRDHPFLIWAP